MYYQMLLLVPVLLPTLVIKAAGDNETNDVIVKYAGHAEANDNRNQRIFVGNKPLETVPAGKVSEKQTVATSATVHENHQRTPPATQPTTPVQYMDETEGVVFVPNDAPTVRLEDEYARDELTIHDVMEKKTVNDIMDRGGVHVETESPHDQIIFVPGSNNENVDRKEAEKKNGRRNTEKAKEGKRVAYPQYKLDCSNLDCNNSMKSICGGKIVNRKLQYRLFLNDCYFRKVNCNFKYKINRYTIVPSEKCAKYGVRGESPFTFSRRVMDTPTKQKEELPSPNSFSSRRSMSMNIYGNFCSHPCPVTCPEDYEPQCAVSATGQHRVFMNHCKLDDNSCLFSIAVPADISGNIRDDDGINIEGAEPSFNNLRRDTQFHLITRRNPGSGQLLVENRYDRLRASNYDSSKRTIIIIHGSRSSIASQFAGVIIDAFLAAEDVNVIGVDWDAASRWGFDGIISSAKDVVRMIRWLLQASGRDNLADFHIIGHHTGAHLASFIGKEFGGQIGYITALDPEHIWALPNSIQPSDAVYTEVIHTNEAGAGYQRRLGQVNFFANGGVQQPGCNNNNICSSDRAFRFMAESLKSGRFLGVECASVLEALEQNCNGPNSLLMGGLSPKIGSNGIFYVRTNAVPPFAQG